MPPPITTIERWMSFTGTAHSRNELDEGLLRERPLVLRGVVLRRGEALPVGLVELGKIAAVIVAGPAPLLAEEHVPRVRLGAIAPLPALPHAPQPLQGLGAPLW